MSLDITPLVPAGRQLIERYGAGGFKVAGDEYNGSVIIHLERTISWGVQTGDNLTLDSLAPVFDVPQPTEILLVGCGPKFIPPPKELRLALKSRGVALEWMDTGAACRTFNVLLAEERSVSAALIAID